MRIICSSGYLSHSEPLFIKLNVLKFDSMFTHQVLNFWYDLINKNLPAYFNNMSSLLQTITYLHDIRQRKKYSLPLVKRVFARKCMRFCIPDILKKTSNMITDKIKTHSRKGLTAYIKLFLINKYDPICSTSNCYICSLDYWILIYLILLFHLSWFFFFNYYYFFLNAWTSSFMVFDVPVGVWHWQSAGSPALSASRPWWDIARLAYRLPNNVIMLS